MSSEDLPLRSKRYAAVKTRLLVADIVLTTVSLLMFQVFLSRSLSEISFNISSDFYLTRLLFIIPFLIFIYLTGLPVHLASSFFAERAFSLSTRTFTSWLKDEVKAVILSGALSAACLMVFYAVLRNFPHFWWAIAAFLWIAFSVVLAGLLPVIIIPIFYRYIPINDTVLKERILRLADRCGVSLLDVCGIELSAKTTKANAALVGLGKTRRVILGDTLTARFTAGETETVVAHEFAHFKYGHMWKLLAGSSVITLAAFYILYQISTKVVSFTGAAGISDPYILPVIFILSALFGMVAAPFKNLYSRVLERQADAFALDVTDDPGTFISVMNKLADMNLADREPNFIKKIFLYDHPPISERIDMGERYKRIKDKG